MSITPEQVTELATAIPVGSWSHSPSTGSPQTGGFQAQVWDAKGDSVLWLEAPLGPEADALAAFIAAAPDMATLIAQQTETIKRLESETADKAARITRLEQLLGQHADEVAEVERLREDAARVEALEQLLKRTITYHNAQGKVVEPAATDIFIQAGHRDRCVMVCLRRGHMDMKRHISAGNVRAAIDILINGESETLDAAIRQQGERVGW